MKEFLMLIFIVVAAGTVLVNAGGTVGKEFACKEKTTVVSSGTFYPGRYFICEENGYGVVRRDAPAFLFLPFIIVSGDMNYFAEILPALILSSSEETYLFSLHVHGYTQGSI